jgi:hypothetical protein
MSHSKWLVSILPLTFLLWIIIRDCKFESPSFCLPQNVKSFHLLLQQPHLFWNHAFTIYLSMPAQIFLNPFAVSIPIIIPDSHSWNIQFLHRDLSSLSYTFYLSFLLRKLFSPCVNVAEFNMFLDPHFTDFKSLLLPFLNFEILLQIYFTLKQYLRQITKYS